MNKAKRIINPIKQNFLHRITAVASLYLMLVVPALHSLTPLPAVAAQSGKQKDASKKKGVVVIDARPVMWQEPVDLESRDLFYGPGGKDGAPDPQGRFTFLRESKGGTQKKLIVKDDRGREWTVKFGPEARPETTAARLVWAVGFHTDQDYFVRQARIDGVDPKDGGDARNVRFERRDDGYKEQGNWSWQSNLFLGSRELDGLKVMMALIKNWDLKTDNNRISRWKPKRGGGGEELLVYYVSDLGASFGRTGSLLNKVPPFGDLPADETFFGASKSKGDPDAFRDEKFISGTHHGVVKFHSERTRVREILKGVSVANARWIGGLLARLSEKQLQDAFRAGGFNDQEVADFVSTLQARIRQLQQL